MLHTVNTLRDPSRSRHSDKAITCQCGALSCLIALFSQGFACIAKAQPPAYCRLSTVYRPKIAENPPPPGGPGSLRPECRKGQSKNCTLFSLPRRLFGLLTRPRTPMGQPKANPALFFGHFGRGRLASKVRNRPQTAAGGRVFLVFPGFGHKKTPGAAGERAPGAVRRGETEPPGAKTGASPPLGSETCWKSSVLGLYTVQQLA